MPLLGSNGHDTSRHGSLDSHTSTDDGVGSHDNWSAAPKLVVTIHIKTQITHSFSPFFSEPYHHQISEYLRIVLHH